MNVRRLVIHGAVACLLATMLQPAWAAVSLNTSRSNIYRMTYPADLVRPAQVTALLTDLDGVGRAWTTSGNEAELRQWLAANFRRHGVQEDRVKKIVILFPTRAREQTYGFVDATTWILLLTDPADEVQAIAFTVQAIREELGKSSDERRENEGEGGGDGY